MNPTRLPQLSMCIATVNRGRESINSGVDKEYGRTVLAFSLIALTYSLIPKPNPRMIRIDLMNSRYFFGNWFNASRKP